MTARRFHYPGLPDSLRGDNGGDFHRNRCHSGYGRIWQTPQSGRSRDGALLPPRPSHSEGFPWMNPDLDSEQTLRFALQDRDS